MVDVVVEDNPTAQQAVRVIQSAARAFLPHKPTIWPTSASTTTESSAIKAIREEGTSYAVRVRRGKALVWVSYDSLQMSERRLADRFMREHDVTAAM